MKRTSIHTSEGSKKAKRGRYGCLESLELEQTADGRSRSRSRRFDAFLYRCLGKAVFGKGRESDGTEEATEGQALSRALLSQNFVIGKVCFDWTKSSSHPAKASIVIQH